MLTPNVTGLPAFANFLIGYATGSFSVAVGAGCHHAHNDVQTHMARQTANQGIKQLNNALRMSQE